MSMVRLVIREAACDWSGTIHGSCADRVVAALSADPVTLEELETATERFLKPNPGRSVFASFSRWLNPEPYDAGVVVIDLVARMVFADSTYSLPGPEGTVQYHNGKCCTDTTLRYHLADDWVFLRAGSDWECTAASRRRERASRPEREARAVFYGRPMLEFVARECLAAFAKRETGPHDLDNSDTDHSDGVDRRDRDTIARIHAAWMLTQRNDLGGACPREVAVERHRHIQWDLEDRCHQWSALRACPRGLDETSHAFRYGGFGTHELVVYYDLVRHLVESCWDRLTELEHSPSEQHRPAWLTAGDFLTTEVPRLETARDAWLDAPDSEFHGRTPRSIIARERARLPEGMSRQDAIHDPDCPCCQMLADMPGPMFWHLDGCNMDDDFAFDFHHETREEWEAEQRRWEEHRKRWDAEWTEREQLGVCRNDDLDGIWTRSFSVGDMSDLPLGVRVFSVGGKLAELIIDLRGVARDSAVTPEVRQLIDALNRDFGNLRELLQSSDASLASALLDPVRNRFAETLDEVAAVRPDLSLKCDSLSDDLRRLLNAPSVRSEYGDPDDFDIPF